VLGVTCNSLTLTKQSELMKLLMFTVFTSLLLMGSDGEVKQTSAFNSSDKTQVILRLDDIGFCHSVNMASKILAEAGVPYSTSLMVSCPWYKESVEVLKKYPEISVGVHLTLSSEWRNYRWGPVLGKEAVPSLVNEEGHFFYSTHALLENKPDITEVENELRAQIKRALNTGLTIDYVDTHMDIAGSKELREVVVKLAKEFKLGISGCFGEARLSTYDVPYEEKKDAAIVTLSELEPGKTYLYVMHVGMDTPEMSALEQIGENSLLNMSKNREAQLNTLLSDAFREAVKKYNIELITYREFIKKNGWENMNTQDYLKR